MPKAVKLKSHRRVVSTAVPYVSPFGINQNSDANKITNLPSASVPLSRGQKKRQAKKERVAIKLGKMPLKSVKTKPISKENVSLLLSELERSLPTIDSSEDLIRPAAFGTTNKMKKSIAVREAQRMKLVQNHPAFLQDPIAAIKNHLEFVIQQKELKKKSSK